MAKIIELLKALIGFINKIAKALGFEIEITLPDFEMPELPEIKL